MNVYELKRKKVGQTFPDEKKARRFMGCEFTYRLSEHEKETQNESATTSHSKRLQIVLHVMATERRQGDGGTGPNERYELSPLELLTEFRMSFAKGEHILNFDLGLFSSSCEDFLRHIQKKLSPESTTDETQFACVILEDYAKGGNMLAKAAEIMKEHIMTKGDFFANSARARSAGKKQGRPRLYDVADELQVQLAEDPVRFKGAGTSIARAGKVVALYHPRLTAKTLEKARKHATSSGCVSLPAYMMRTASASVEDTVSRETAEASGDKANPGTNQRKDSLNPIDSKSDSEATAPCSGSPGVDEVEKGNSTDDPICGEVEHAQEGVEAEDVAGVEEVGGKMKSNGGGIGHVPKHAGAEEDSEVGDIREAMVKSEKNRKKKSKGGKKKLTEKKVVSWNFS